MQKFLGSTGGSVDQMSLFALEYCTYQRYSGAVRRALIPSPKVGTVLVMAKKFQDLIK